MTRRDPNLSPGLPAQLEAVVAKTLARLGLIVDRQQFLGQHMLFHVPVRGGPAERRKLELDRIAYWREVPMAESAIMAEAIAMLESFAARFGPGRIWAMVTPAVHLINDDGIIVHHAAEWDGRVVRLRRLIAHEAAMVADPPRAP